MCDFLNCQMHLSDLVHCHASNLDCSSFLQGRTRPTATRCNLQQVQDLVGYMLWIVTSWGRGNFWSTRFNAVRHVCRTSRVASEIRKKYNWMIKINYNQLYKYCPRQDPQRYHYHKIPLLSHPASIEFFGFVPPLQCEPPFLMHEPWQFALQGQWPDQRRWWDLRVQIVWTPFLSLHRFDPAYGSIMVRAQSLTRYRHERDNVCQCKRENNICRSGGRCGVLTVATWIQFNEIPGCQASGRSHGSAHAFAKRFHSKWHYPDFTPALFDAI